MAVNLHLDQDAFQAACSGLEEKCRNLEALSGQIQSSFEQLRQDWDSQAGKLFFERFENDLIKNLDQFTVVMEHMNQNLSSASQQYEEVFEAAEAVANGQF